MLHGPQSRDGNPSLFGHVHFFYLLFSSPTPFFVNSMPSRIMTTYVGSLPYPVYIYCSILLFFASQFVFFFFVVCGYCISIPFFTSRLELGPGTSYWVSTVLSLVFSVLSWISFRFWTWRRDRAILKWTCPIFAVGLGLDIFISLPFAIRIEESPHIKLLRTLPLLLGGLSTVYMFVGWLCLVRYGPLVIPSIYEPIANARNQGDGYDLVPSTGPSAGKCETLFRTQLLSYQAAREDQDEGTRPTSNTAQPIGLTSVSNGTQLEQTDNYGQTLREVPKEASFSPALIFWEKGHNPFPALIVALPFILIWSGVNMAYQISSYYGTRDGGEISGR
ncbi:hypothetical protein F4818DRAFT_350844 [Hypoxylon cercidicola]|nr:hypothetical protein F4818DRAFT_350844 [Hypoxylon cercidicola]